ncbi:FKBP-type peptidyl-prolyl cis-trans isomerase [Bdellovibrio bacteriovorus]|uniref:FKBP-type peptidyl-prolyl cis-trans isomerase n=1 Tax=Bdellovibrio bacteriovorus TaxID=959 RepID=UPI0021D241D1|nr:FKBP-type peptidyl-prolyl cis-trans isomerase [Bdellovibrio bacteriovorus]UXR64763.1 FKBP-type peptidyl-prolyl cis-trans isomerase [Bdellovibrio bacteriovorus]
MNVQIVSFHCVLKNKLGQIISSTYNRDVLTSLPEGTDHSLPGLSVGLKDIRKGEKRQIELSAEEAYGFYDTTKVLELARESLVGSSKLKVGESVLFAREGKNVEKFRVTDLSQDRITLDGNHPLAGQDLIFEIEALDVREATPEEIQDSLPEESDDGILRH